MRSIQRFSHLLLFGATALLAVVNVGCEEYIDPPFELQESRLIISSNFSPDDKVTVRLTASQPAVGPDRTTQIENADIAIYEGDALVEMLTFYPGEAGDQGVYRTQVFEPETGISYTLRASAPGFTPVTASSSIPTSTDITRLLISELDISTNEQGLLVYNFNLLVDYDDPSFAENFYDIRIRQRVYPFHVISGTHDTILLDPVYKTVEPLSDVTEENTRAGESSYLIADKPGGGIIVGLVSKINPHKEILGDLVVELRTVSRDYYEFQSAIQQERRIYNTYFERGVTPSFSNVGGGYGVFAGYSQVTRAFPLAAD